VTSSPSAHVIRRMKLIMKLSRPKTQRYLKAAAQKTVQVALLVSLFVSQWRAPLPWLHRHHESTSAELAQQLDSHRTTWHSQSETEQCGWHLHFALLDDILRGGGCPVPPEEGDEEFPFIEEHVAPAKLVTKSDGLDFRLTESMWTSQNPCGKAANSCRSQALLGRFLGGHAEPRHLLTVLCVAQC
jgi:hypothetical protein